MTIGLKDKIWEISDIAKLVEDTEDRQKSTISIRGAFKHFLLMSGLAVCLAASTPAVSAVVFLHCLGISDSTKKPFTVSVAIDTNANKIIDLGTGAHPSYFPIHSEFAETTITARQITYDMMYQLLIDRISGKFRFAEIAQTHLNGGTQMSDKGSDFVGGKCQLAQRDF